MLLDPPQLDKQMKIMRAARAELETDLSDAPGLQRPRKDCCLFFNTKLAQPQRERTMIWHLMLKIINEYWDRNMMVLA
jgi:hypothetical protein